MIGVLAEIRPWILPSVLMDMYWVGNNPLVKILARGNVNPFPAQTLDFIVLKGKNEGGR
jgi:hypothetical protein